MKKKNEYMRPKLQQLGREEAQKRLSEAASTSKQPSGKNGNNPKHTEVNEGAQTKSTKKTRE